MTARAMGRPGGGRPDREQRGGGTRPERAAGQKITNSATVRNGHLFTPTVRRPGGGAAVSARPVRFREEPEHRPAGLGLLARCALCGDTFIQRHPGHQYCADCWPWSAAWLWSADPWRRRAALGELARRSRA